MWQESLNVALILYWKHFYCLTEWKEIKETYEFAAGLQFHETCKSFH